MGTNFYCIKRVTDEDIKCASDFINKRRLIELKKHLNNRFEEVHIGKRSGGWQFCFDHNWGEYYNPDRKSLEEFLKGQDIYDEYGEKYSYEEFWKMIEEWNSNPRNTWVSNTYQEYEKSKDPNFYNFLDRENIRKCKEKFGIVTDSNDFEVDGLRFSVFTDFC